MDRRKCPFFCTLTWHICIYLRCTAFWLAFDLFGSLDAEAGVGSIIADNGCFDDLAFLFQISGPYWDHGKNLMRGSRGGCILSGFGESRWAIGHWGEATPHHSRTPSCLKRCGLRRKIDRLRSPTDRDGWWWAFDPLVVVDPVQKGFNGFTHQIPPAGLGYCWFTFPTSRWLRNSTIMVGPASKYNHLESDSGYLFIGSCWISPDIIQILLADGCRWWLPMVMGMNHSEPQQRSPTMLDELNDSGCSSPWKPATCIHES